MSNEAKVTWERYVSSWKTESPGEARKLFKSCLAPGCVYTDPLATARGWDEIVAYMAAFHQQIPGGHFVTVQFYAHNGRSAAGWKMLDGAGAEIGTGISYGEYDEQGLLTAMTGFFEPPPPQI